MAVLFSQEAQQTLLVINKTVWTQMGVKLKTRAGTAHHRTLSAGIG